MKKIIAITLLAASFAAHAGGATLCPIYEFAELQSMNKEELNQAKLHDIDQIMRSNDYELENCKAQITRIDRVMVMKGYVSDKPYKPPVKTQEVSK